MLKKCSPFGFYLAMVLALIAFETRVLGYDVTDKFSVGGIMAGNWQYLDADDIVDGEETDDGPKASFVFQPEIS